MIKAEEGKIHIKGDIPEILTDLTGIIKAIREEKWFEEKMLEDALELSKLDKEGIERKLEDTVMQKLLELLQNADDTNE